MCLVTWVTLSSSTSSALQHHERAVNIHIRLSCVTIRDSSTSWGMRARVALEGAKPLSGSGPPSFCGAEPSQTRPLLRPPSPPMMTSRAGRASTTGAGAPSLALVGTCICRTRRTKQLQFSHLQPQSAETHAACAVLYAQTCAATLEIHPNLLRCCFSVHLHGVILFVLMPTGLLVLQSMRSTSSHISPSLPTWEPSLMVTSIFTQSPWICPKSSDHVTSIACQPLSDCVPGRQFCEQC